MSTQDDDDRQNFLSGSEDYESLMGDKKQWYSPELETSKPSKMDSFTKAFRSYRWLIDIFLLFIIIGLLLLLLRGPWKNPPSTPWQVGGDFTGTAPKLPTKIVKFEADMAYAPMNTSHFFTDETLGKWKKMLPVGTGYGSTDDAFFTTSMTHQLHCVYMMARIFSGIASNITQSLPNDYQMHFLHCVDYLRQSIMCSADLALEAHDVTDSDDLGPLDGSWSGRHVCKDYSQVISYLEEQIADGIRVVLPIDD